MPLFQALHHQQTRLFLANRIFLHPRKPLLTPNKRNPMLIFKNFKLYEDVVMLSKIKILKSILSISLATLSFCSLSSYADTSSNSSVDNLVAGYGKIAIGALLMNKAPTNDDLTIAINNAQATYLLFPTSLLVSPLTQQLLSQSANLKNHSNNIIAFTWNPHSKTNPDVEKNPLQSIDINSLYNLLVITELKPLKLRM